MLKTILIALLLISPICFGQTIDPTLQINWGTGYVNNINNVYVPGAVANPTLAGAVNAAGATGSMIIPADYTGADTFLGLLASGTYTSGITATGTIGQTCTLTALNNYSTGTATVALTGTNTIAGGTALVITSAGTGAGAAPTSATAGNGTATCTGTATIATAIGSNPHNIKVTDNRPLSNAYTAVMTVSAADYGATCRGVNHSNDTAGIQAAINVAAAYNQPLATNENIAVVLPQGSCVIVAPLVMTGFSGSLIGTGEGSTYIVADYTAWTNSGNYNAIQLTATGMNSGGASIGQRRIGGFSLIGLGNTTSADLPNTTGIQIINTSNVYNPSEYGLSSISFDHLLIGQFDTCVDAEDMVNSQFEFDQIQNCRIGLQFNGDVNNNFVSHSTIDAGSLSFTSTTGGTTAFNVIPNTKYGGGPEQPQGVYFYDNSIEDWTTGILDEECIDCSFDYNQLDLISNIDMQIDEDGIGGYGIWIDHNTFGMDTNAGSGLYVAGVADSPTPRNVGFWAEDNHFQLDNYPTAAPSSNVGIILNSVAALTNAHINGNQCMGMATCIALDSDLQYSEIRNNYAVGALNYVVNLAGASSLVHTGTVVDGNQDSFDSIPAVNIGTATGFHIGYNVSATQWTGTQIVSVSGCTITAGAVGNTCNTTITFASDGGVAMFNTSYKPVCSASGSASGSNLWTLGNINTLTDTTMVIPSIALTASATGGGTIFCTVSSGQ